MDCFVRLVGKTPGISMSVWLCDISGCMVLLSIKALNMNITGIILNLVVALPGRRLPVRYNGEDPLRAVIAALDYIHCIKS
mmetsp:Transcript_5473/g.9516  ORF Transcript_5473/g.9516 Transcript_5473/m.9516 type:complete len:81 (+) Transcript_5473:350-592(+)